MDETADALSAIIIFDQLHKIAVTMHRDFVIKYLEPWLQLAEEELESICDDDNGWTSDDVASLSFRLHMLDTGYYESSSVPLWTELEDAAPLAQSDKRNEARKAKTNERRRKGEENMLEKSLVPDHENDLMEER